MDDEAYEPTVETPACQVGYFTWMTPLILGVQVIEEMGRAVVDGLSGLKMSLCHHENYRLELEQFTAEAGRELEKILEVPKED
jgi:hypothetical protein